MGWQEFAARQLISAGARDAVTTMGIGAGATAVGMAGLNLVQGDSVMDGAMGGAFLGAGAGAAVRYGGMKYLQGAMRQADEASMYSSKYKTSIFTNAEKDLLDANQAVVERGGFMEASDAEKAFAAEWHKRNAAGTASSATQPVNPTTAQTNDPNANFVGPPPKQKANVNNYGDLKKRTDSVTDNLLSKVDDLRQNSNADIQTIDPNARSGFGGFWDRLTGRRPPINQVTGLADNGNDSVANAIEGIAITQNKGYKGKSHTNFDELEARALKAADARKAIMETHENKYPTNLNTTFERLKSQRSLDKRTQDQLIAQADKTVRQREKNYDRAIKHYDNVSRRYNPTPEDMALRAQRAAKKQLAAEQNAANRGYKTLHDITRQAKINKLANEGAKGQKWIDNKFNEIYNSRLTTPPSSSAGSNVSISGNGSSFGSSVNTNSYTINSTAPAGMKEKNPFTFNTQPSVSTQQQVSASNKTNKKRQPAKVFRSGTDLLNAIGVNT